MIKLNLGCGAAVYEGYINVDVDKQILDNKEPGIKECWDLKKRFPLADGIAEEILLIHTIEHIEKKHHESLFLECHRVLCKGGLLVLAYPEFKVCAKYYIENKRGQRDFWERTIYGRQLYPSDFHVSLMDTDELLVTLTQCGFKNIQFAAEPIPNENNTILKCTKESNPQLLKDDVTRDGILAI